MLSIRLPVEIIEEIVTALVVPPASVLKHGIHHGIPSSDTFRQLCLVNHFMHHFCIPLLYSSVAIWNVRQHDALIYTLHRHHSWGMYTRDLWLELPGATDLLHNLLYLLGPSLRRVAMTNVTVSHPFDLCYVSDALRMHCRNIQDFEYMQNLLAHEKVSYSHQDILCWPEMPKLQRLVIDHTRINESFVESIRRVPYLGQLCLLNPVWSGGNVRIFKRLFENASSLKNVSLVFLGSTNSMASVTYVVDKMAELRSALGPLHGVPGVRAIAVLGDEEGVVIEYTRKLISCGDIWNLLSGCIEIDEGVVTVSDF